MLLLLQVLLASFFLYFFSLFPFFFLFSLFFFFRAAFRLLLFFYLFFFLPSRSSFSPFFVVPVPRRILILVHTGVEEERVSESDRRCGPADERYHPVMVYLNQPSGSSIHMEHRLRRKTLLGRRRSFDTETPTG